MLEHGPSKSRIKPLITSLSQGVTPPSKARDRFFYPSMRWRSEGAARKVVEDHCIYIFETKKSSQFANTLQVA